MSNDLSYWGLITSHPLLMAKVAHVRHLANQDGRASIKESQGMEEILWSESHFLDPVEAIPIDLFY